MDNWQKLDPIWQAVLTQAIKTYLKGTTPIGAAVVSETGEIVSRGYSKAHAERLNHAETEAIRKIPRTTGRYELYTTLEPCPYCTGAIRMEKLHAVHFAARDPSAGSTHLLNVGEFMQEFSCTVNPPLNPILEAAVVALVMEHRARDGHQRWRDHWRSYHESGVEVGESLALKKQYAEWVQRGVTPETLYDEVCANFR